MSSQIPDITRRETCEECGHEFLISLRELYSEDRTFFDCPKCGHRNLLKLTKIEELIKESLDNNA